MSRFVAAVSFLLILVASVAQGDVLHLKNGGRLEGRVTKEGDAYRVEIRPGLEVKIPASDVERLEVTPVPREEALARMEKLLAYDAQGHFELAVWCIDRGLVELATDLLLRTLRIAPDHEGARARLGHRRVEGEWVTEDEFYGRQGLVRYRSRWVTPGEKERLEFAEREQAVQKKVKRLVHEIRTHTTESAENARKAILGFAEPEARGPVLALLDHHAEEIRALGARAATTFMDEDVAGRLARMSVDEEDPRIRDAAISTLSQTRYPDVGDGLLMDYLMSPNRTIRDRAARVLGAMRYRHAIRPFIETLTREVSRRRLLPLVRSLYGRRLQGGASAWVDVGLSHYVRVTDWEFNEAAHDALVQMTGRDFHYDQDRWRAWWEAEGARFGLFMEQEEKPGSQ